METIKMTRALLDSYRKLLREINLLEKELEGRSWDWQQCCDGL